MPLRCEHFYRSRLVVLLITIAMMPAERLLAHAPTQSVQLGEASMSFADGRLTVTTGAFSREWKVTSAGLKTVTLSLDGRQIDCRGDKPAGCDWDLGGCGTAELVSIAAKRDNDEGFTSEHLRVTASFAYPDAGLLVRYAVWAYPGAPGMRTQLQLKALPGYDGEVANLSPQVVESAPLRLAGKRLRAFGLMQGIKSDMDVRIAREEVVGLSSGGIDWANGIVLDDEEGNGVVVVKESNKHTHINRNADVATGGFAFADDSLSVTGAGLYARDIDESAWKNCWATWLIGYRGGDDQRELALKRFDRRRYPIDPQRDIYVMANTWGTEDTRPPCLHAAREENVLQELESVADLGIDVLQVDDGWQTPQWTTAVAAREVQHGAAALQQFGDYAVYPEGWAPVRRRAEELGVTLGLWAAWTAPTEALIDNHDLGGFQYFKLDFANLNSKAKYDGLAAKARQLIKHSGGRARVNWDVTETATRMGFFSGREYGNVYLANRKTRTRRPSVLYVPHKVLNEAWNLSRYVNLNKFQVTVQNVDHVMPGAPTDAAAHPHDYAVGIALMASPIFFQETRYYRPEVRDQIRSLLSIYREHRRRMFDGYVFPIGSEPDNRSWTGFQNVDPDTGTGYLAVFRERLNDQQTAELRLRFIRNKTLMVTDLLTGEREQVEVGPDGRLDCELDSAPGFAFLSYAPLPPGVGDSSP